MKKYKTKEERKQEYIQFHIARIKRLKQYHKQGIICVPMDMRGVMLRQFLLYDEEVFDDNIIGCDS